jgi:hypothetical protein
MSHQVFHDAQSFEAWIQHDSHHVVSFPHVKRFQKLQKELLITFTTPSHIFVCRRRISTSKVSNILGLLKSYNIVASISILKVVVVKAFDNNQQPLD